MKKIFGQIVFYALVVVLLSIFLGQIGVLPIKLAYFRSGSMSPTYLPGDLAIIYTGSQFDVNPGDVVLFYSNGEPVIHRVVGFDESGRIITRGDANQNPDPVPVAKVNGLLMFSLPKLGYVVGFLQNLIFSVSNLIFHR